MPQLRSGEHAPAFRLKDQHGHELDSSSLRGRRAVIYFFPKADTPGWTTEARQFDERLREFEERGVRVIGISRDDPEDLSKFCSKYDFELTFLSDPDHAVHDAYGAWGERPLRGEGVIRSTVLVGADGKVERAWYGVGADGHAKDVLAAL